VLPASPSDLQEDWMSDDGPGAAEVTGQWGTVALAWVLVGVPLLWGVWNTLLKAAALFR
jgi:hypothetical protein